MYEIKMKRQDGSNANVVLEQAESVLDAIITPELEMAAEVINSTEND